MDHFKAGNQFCRGIILVLLTGCLISWSLPVAAGSSYETSFARGEWDRDDWIQVKSPRWDYIGQWIQNDDHIKNLTPEDARPDRLIGGHQAQTSMVLKDPFPVVDGLEVSTRMEFDFDQGPQIVLAGRLGADENGYPEYRDHYEIVLFARGINIWHHVYRDGRPSWGLVAYHRFPLERRTVYELKVRIEEPRNHPGGPAVGKMIVVSVDGDHVFAYHEPSLPNEVHVGITAYASINRFYDFKAVMP